MRGATVAALALAAAVPPAVPLPAFAASSRSAPHVIVILEENRSEADVIGSADAPYVNALARAHGLVTLSFGQSHPSLPNYLELISGSTWGVTDDGTGYSFSGPTLAGQLSAQGISWRAYMEGIPGACYGGSGGGGYAKKHDPFMYFSSITGNPALCNNIVPYSQLSSDLAAASLPAFVWITPNLCNDGHDCSTATMDSWLRSHLQPLLTSSWFASDGVAIITWDEGSDSTGCCNGAHGGHIATVVVSTRVHTHVSADVAVDHAGLLRTVEQLYSLPYLGDAGCACSGDLGSLIGAAPSTPPSPPVTAAYFLVPRWR